MGINVFDQYSLLHFATGIVAYFWGISFEAWLVMHTIFEIVENTGAGMFLINETLGDIWPGGKKYPDSFVNSAADIVFSMIGWLTAKWLDEFGSKHNLYPRHVESFVN